MSLKDMFKCYANQIKNPMKNQSKRIKQYLIRNSMKTFLNCIK